MSNRRFLTASAILAGVLAGAAVLSASGPIGIFGVIEKVVFEPDQANAERAQIWGAFVYAEGGITNQGGQVSPIRHGFLYFRLAPAAASAQTNLVRAEWRDLSSVAGTGQVVGFGNWGYIGGFGGLDPAVKSTQPPYILELFPGRGELTDMRVRPATEAPSNPAVYQTNTGVVKIPESGNYADLVKKLREAIK
jgi:hypothetical protein